MDGLIFNFNFCINPYVESLLVHCSYLIGDRTIAAGSTRQSHFNFTDLSVSFEVKLKVLEDMMADKEEAETLQKMSLAFKRFKKIKHPPASLIGPFRKMQRCISDIYEIHISQYKEQLDNIHYIHMADLAPYGFFDWYNLDEDLLVKIPGEKSAPLRDIMALLPNQLTDRQLSYVLPAVVFENIPVFGEPPKISTPHIGEEPDLSFVYPCFELPNLFLHTRNELHTIKMQLKEVAKNYHSKTDAWVFFCKHNTDTIASHSFFKEEVLPAASLLQDAISKNQLLFSHQHCGNDKQSITISLGEISPANVWQLLEKENLNPSTDGWKELMNQKELPAFSRPLPVIIVNLAEEAMPEHPLNVNSLSLKKSININ